MGDVTRTQVTIGVNGGMIYKTVEYNVVQTLAGWLEMGHYMQYLIPRKIRGIGLASRCNFPGAEGNR